MNASDYIKAGQTVLSNLFIKNFRKLGLDSAEFTLWLQIYMYKESNENTIDFQLIAEDLDVPVQEVYKLVNQLITKGMLAIQSERNSSGQLQDSFLVEPAYEKLALLLKQKEEKQKENSTEIQIREMYRLFESEFGRPLSSIEFQRIQQWLSEDNYAIELIELALKEAVLNQVYNFNYIDRILLAWERKNIKTKQQVDAAQKDRKRQQMQNFVERDEMPSKKDLPKVTLHNWLEEGNDA